MSIKHLLKRGAAAGRGRGLVESAAAAASGEEKDEEEWGGELLKGNHGQLARLEEGGCVSGQLAQCQVS